MKIKQLLISLSVFALLFVSCKSEANITTNKYKVSVNLSKGTAAGVERTITVLEDYDITTMDWSVYFYKSDDLINSVARAEESGGVYTAELPVGEYIATASATFQNDGVSYLLFGSSEFEVTQSVQTRVNIYVGLSKRTTGRLSQITLDFSEVEFEFGDTCNSAYLTPVAGGEPITLTVSDYDVTENTVEISYDSDINSGFYYLTVEWNGIDEGDVLPLVLSDSLVEITDNKNLTGTVKVLDSTFYKTYYVNSDGTGNGLSPSSPITFEDLISSLPDTKQNITLYMNEDPVWTNIPSSTKFDVYITKDGIQSCYRVADNTWSLIDGVINLYFSNDGDHLITHNITGSLDSLDTLVLNNFVNVNFLNISYSNNKKINLSITDDNLDNPYSSYLDNNVSFCFYNPTDSSDVPNFSFVLDEDGAELYGVLNAIIYDSYFYFFADKYTPGISIVKFIPQFEIKSEGLTYLEDAEIVYTAIPKSGEFPEGTEFVWKLNGALLEDENDCSVAINPVRNFAFNESDNVLECTAIYENEALNITKNILFDKYLSVDCYGDNWLTNQEYNRIYSTNLDYNSIKNDFYSLGCDAFCLDSQNNFYVYGSYVNMDDESYNGFVKFVYSIDKKFYTKPTILSTVDNVARMACDDKNIYFIKANDITKYTSENDNFYNSIYVTSATEADEPVEISLADDFDYITAITYNNGMLYVAGESKTYSAEVQVYLKNSTSDLVTENGTVYNYTYKVVKYPVADGTIDVEQGVEYLSYTDQQVVEDVINPLFDINLTTINTDAYSFVKLANSITDLAVVDNTVYALRSIKAITGNYTSNSENRVYYNKSSDYYITSLLYNDETNGLSSILISTLNGGNTTYSKTPLPIRFVCIKKNEAIFEDTNQKGRPHVDLKTGKVTLDSVDNYSEVESFIDASSGFDHTLFHLYGRDGE